jgi:hypothetical protein
VPLKWFPIVYEEPPDWSELAEFAKSLVTSDVAEETD